MMFCTNKKWCSWEQSTLHEIWLYVQPFISEFVKTRLLWPPSWTPLSPSCICIPVYILDSIGAIVRATSVNPSVVVAQLVERSFPIPEVRGSNPVFGKNLYWTFVCCQLCVEKTKIKKRGREWPIFLKVKTNLRTFWATLKFNLATFYFNIWSHCDHHWSVLLHHSEPVNLNPSRAAGLTK